MPTRLMIVVATALSTLAVPVAAANRKVDVINKTGMTMTSFFASSTGTESWEEDMLDNDTLDDGETLEADIDDATPACVYDFKAAFSNGASVVKQKVNVCEISTFSFLP